VLLRHLLEAAVQVADFRLSIGDDLTVEADDGPERAVTGRVRRTKVKDLGLEVVLVLKPPGRPRRLVLLALAQQPALSGVVVLAQRMTLERWMAEDPLQVRVALEADAEHVVRLALKPVRRLPHAVDGRHQGVVLPHRHLEPDAVTVRDRVEVVDDLEALFAAGIVDAADVGQELEVERRVVLQAPRQAWQHTLVHA